MATINLLTRDGLYSGTTGSTDGPSWFAKVLSGIRQGWRAYVRYKRLSVMSGEALQKRGLVHDQIAHEAYFGDGEL